MLTKIKFKSKDHALKDVRFNVVKIVKTETLMDRHCALRRQLETTYSIFVGETDSTKEELTKFIENRAIEITDSSCRVHQGTFVYFKLIRNNEYEVSFCISRDVDNPFKASIKEI